MRSTDAPSHRPGAGEPRSRGAPDYAGPAPPARAGRVGADPTPTIIAGTGEDITDDASRGDGGPATEGRFHQVDGLDWSLGGNILVADGDDGRIRRITPSGNIVTNSTEGLADPIAVVSTGFVAERAV